MKKKKHFLVTWPDLIFVEEELTSSKELENLAENFREQASKLVDMLDISIPVVSKLKVRTIVLTLVMLNKLRCHTHF